MKTPHAGTFWVGEVLEETRVAELQSWIRRGAPLPVRAEVAERLFDRKELAELPEDFVSLQPSVRR